MTGMFGEHSEVLVLYLEINFKHRHCVVCEKREFQEILHSTNHSKHIKNV